MALGGIAWWMASGRFSFLVVVMVLLMAGVAILVVVVGHL